MTAMNGLLFSLGSTMRWSGVDYGKLSGEKTDSWRLDPTGAVRHCGNWCEEIGFA